MISPETFGVELSLFSLHSSVDAVGEQSVQLKHSELVNYSTLD